MIVIVGAGLAGLSTAYHLSGTPYRLYEREEQVGGLCRSYQKDGFTFDYTGHLLHFRQPEIKALVERLLAERLPPGVRPASTNPSHPPVFVFGCRLTGIRCPARSRNYGLMFASLVILV